MQFNLYTDGACSPNPGPGGWAFILINQSTMDETIRFGCNKNTTNNRMEMQAMLEGLECFYKSIWTGKEQLIAYSDSAYLINGITSWVDKWIKNNWRVSSKKGVLNPDLWQQLYDYRNILKPKFEHIRGHNGHVENERVDKLAVAARLSQ